MEFTLLTFRVDTCSAFNPSAASLRCPCYPCARRVQQEIKKTKPISPMLLIMSLCNARGRANIPPSKGTYSTHPLAPFARIVWKWAILHTACSQQA